MTQNKTTNLIAKYHSEGKTPGYKKLDSGVGRPGRFAAPSTTPLSPPWWWCSLVCVASSSPLLSMPSQLTTIMVLIWAHYRFCLHTKALSVSLISMVKHHVSCTNYTLQSSQLWSTILHHVTLRLITNKNQSTKSRISRACDTNALVTRFKD